MVKKSLHFIKAFVLVVGSLGANNSNVIDVVIPCHEKDARTLNLAIKGIKRHGKNVRRIIVVSAKKLTEHAEWFDESQFPFDFQAIALEMFKGDQNEALRYINTVNSF